MKGLDSDRRIIYSAYGRIKTDHRRPVRGHEELYKQFSRAMSELGVRIQYLQWSIMLKDGSTAVSHHFTSGDSDKYRELFFNLFL